VLFTCALSCLALAEKHALRAPSLVQKDLDKIINALAKIASKENSESSITFDQITKNRNGLMVYRKYELQFSIPPGYNICVPIDIKKIESSLSKRNWFWRQANPEIKERALKRIQLLLDNLDTILQLDRVKNCIGSRRVVAITTAGSYPWHDEPGDIDIHLIIEGEQTFFSIKLSDQERGVLRNLTLYPSGESIKDIILQFFGTENLKKAAKDEDLGDQGDLQRKLLTIYGNAVQLGGLDLFEKSRPPTEDFLIYAYNLRMLSRAGIKSEKRLSEAMVIENYIRQLQDISLEEALRLGEIAGQTVKQGL
jgi:hypothetical protein